MNLPVARSSSYIYLQLGERNFELELARTGRGARELERGGGGDRRKETTATMMLKFSFPSFSAMKGGRMREGERPKEPEGGSPPIAAAITREL